MDRTPRLDSVERSAGIDAGITSLVTLSTGEKVADPRHERRDRARLARAHKELARKQKGSANRDKAKRRVARIHTARASHQGRRAGAPVRRSPHWCGGCAGGRCAR